MHHIAIAVVGINVDDHFKMLPTVVYNGPFWDIQGPGLNKIIFSTKPSGPV